SPVEIVGAKVLTKKPTVVEINMGTPLHRGDFIKSSDGRPSEEQFGEELDNALEELPMDPAESDPTIKDDSAATAEPEEAKVEETKEEAVKATEEKKDPPPPQEKKPENDKKENDRKTRVKRKPRRPRIEGAAEA
ncbi:MAG: hypothetical protein SGILL_005893, partial [Bacillariaceae sp.]